MIEFNFQDVVFDFDEEAHISWLSKTIISEEKTEGDISYLFCTDEYLLKVNQEFLDHDTYTDIITFDNSIGNIVGADICISTERVKENALEFDVSFEDELRRVLVHGVLHICGWLRSTWNSSVIILI